MFCLLPLLLVAVLPVISGFDCPTPNGMFANPADCSNFYNCGHGVAYLTPCAAGTLWDDSIKNVGASEILAVLNFRTEISYNLQQAIYLKQSKNASKIKTIGQV